MQLRTALSLLGLAVCCTTPGRARADVSFSHDIAPIVLKRCTGCHGERANLGGFRTQTFQNLMKSGASGLASVVPHKPDASRVFQLITSTVPAIRMPKSDDPLSKAQVELFRKWIAEGAKFDGTDPSAHIKTLLGPRVHPAAPAAYRAPVPVLAVAFVPGGKKIAVGGYNEVTFWDEATGTLAGRVGHLPQRIQSLCYSPDGKRLLLAGGTPGEYGEVTLIDPASSGPPTVLDTFNDIELAAAFSPDGKRIAAGGSDGGVRVYDTATGKRLWTMSVHSDWVTSVSFSFDGRYLASASRDMTVKIYEAETGTLYATYTGHNRQIGDYRGQDPVYAVRFAPDSLLACSAGGGKWIQLWNPEIVHAEAGDAGDMEERFAKAGHTKYIPHGFTHEVFALAIDGSHIFAASADGVLKEFDLTTQKEVRAYPGQTDWMFAVAVDPANHRVASGSYGGMVQIWDTASGQSISRFRAQPGSTAQNAAPGVRQAAR